MHHRLRIRCSECNYTKIMHARYFRVFCVSWIQIGCSMRVVYAECMNAFYTLWRAFGGHHFEYLPWGHFFIFWNIGPSGCLLKSYKEGVRRDPSSAPRLIQCSCACHISAVHQIVACNHHFNYLPNSFFVFLVFLKTLWVDTVIAPTT